jgi:exosortase A-associated hydrolase 1
VVVVGGPQYGVGSHRQFVLLARELADAGNPVLRFDYRGMGDSEGAMRYFEAVEADVRAAIDTLCSECPEVSEVVLWGLCDAASAAAFHAAGDARIGGVVLLNPWVRTEAGEARARVKHYYRQRLLDPAFWRKVLRLRWNPVRSLAELAGNATRARGDRVRGTGGDRSLPGRMLHGLARFEGRVLLILSGNDLTAREFEDTANASAEWQRWLDSPSVRLERLPEADHTFSRRSWRDLVAALTREWLEAR